jgi:putative transposase
MSRRGNCWDNAVIESFFKTLKTEMIYQLTKLISEQQMKWLIAEYMGHYNHIRPHSTIGYLSPVKFEQKRMEHLAQMENSLGIRKC